MIDAESNGVDAPAGQTIDGKIVLDIAGEAVRDFRLSEPDLSFTATFDGVSHRISAPLDSIISVNSRETAEGISLRPGSMSRPEKEVETQPASKVRRFPLRLLD